MTIPNLISIFRLFIVPAIVWLISIQEYSLSFWLFLIAGVSDGVDGFIAKQFNQSSELGAHLDPLADKVMLVAVFLTLGIQGLLPLWLVILVISRDLLIVGAVVLTWILHQPIPMKPLMVSKANTVAQIILICLVMGGMAFDLDLGIFFSLSVILVAALTLLSTVAYLLDWFSHMGAVEKR
tara:strand:+ start:3337 stop:3879 length:543 start_codon:yes stop_codon:yes gene_type:complete